MTADRPTPEPLFPIQSQRGAAPHPTQIPWSVAELAYSVYSGKYGRDQSLAKLAQRGGFGPNEMDLFLPDWRERCDDNRRLAARVAELEEGLRALKSLELYGNYQTCQGLINPRIDALLAGTPPAAPEGPPS